mmetsp:Transcript_21912/g.61242  ORF Transcript_21912/g.61242 Transcript_21912/m.61242 type:complete len:368 (-) Transcript_21912:68-1171(-)
MPTACNRTAISAGLGGLVVGLSVAAFVAVGPDAANGLKPIILRPVDVAEGSLQTPAAGGAAQRCGDAMASPPLKLAEDFVAIPLMDGDKIVSLWDRSDHGKHVQGGLHCFDRPFEDVAFARRPTVAHCVCGEARLMNHPMAYQNYIKHAVEPLGVSSDIFLVLDYESENKAVYKPAIDYLRPDAIAYVRGDQYAKWEACLWLIHVYENRSDNTYQHIIKGRPDMMVLLDLPPAATFPEKSVWVRPYFEYADETMGTDFDDGTHTWYKSFLNDAAIQDHGLSDLILVMPRRAADAILRLNAFRKDTAKRKAICGAHGHLQECLVKVAFHESRWPIEFRPFQVRILRPHQQERCGFLKAGGKHYNSICV